MTRRFQGTPFEDTVTIAAPPQAEMMQEFAKLKSIYGKTVPLVPGTYRLNVVAKDVVGGNLNNYEVRIDVPRLDPDKATSSGIVLADVLERVPPRSIGTGQFVIGDLKVRPRIGEVFRRDERMGIYLKVYNLGADEATHKPAGQVQYEVVKTGSNEPIYSFTEDFSKIPDATANQITIDRVLPLNSLAPGQYTIRVKVTDKNRNQVLTPSAQFTVT